MKLFLKILLFLLSIFQANISEAKVFDFDKVVSEITFVYDVVGCKNNSIQILENDFGIICKSESDSLDYKNWAKCCKAKAAKTVTNTIPEGKLANHLFKGAGKLADNPANRALIQNISNGKALGVDAFGKNWYTGIDAAGKSIYSYTQNGIVKGAGYMNMTPAEMIIKYGLK